MRPLSKKLLKPVLFLHLPAGACTALCSRCLLYTSASESAGQKPFSPSKIALAAVKPFCDRYAENTPALAALEMCIRDSCYSCCGTQSVKLLTVKLLLK